MAETERKELEEKFKILENNIVLALTPKDDVDERGAVLEVRAGTGK